VTEALEQQTATSEILHPLDLERLLLKARETLSVIPPEQS
jgi:hypothetical protein